MLRGHDMVPVVKIDHFARLIVWPRYQMVLSDYDYEKAAGRGEYFGID